MEHIYIYIIIIILLVIYEYTVADIAYKLISVWDLAKLVGFPILYQPKWKFNRQIMGVLHQTL